MNYPNVWANNSPRSNDNYATSQDPMEDLGNPPLYERASERISPCLSVSCLRFATIFNFYGKRINNMVKTSGKSWKDLD